MLETIKATIKALPEISFSELFHSYVMEVQDTSLESEISTILRNNRMDLVVMSQIIAKNYEKVTPNDS